MSYIPEYHENYYRVEGTAYNQGKIGIGTINPVQLLHVSGGNIRVDGTGYVNGDLNITGNLNVYGTAAQFAVSQIIAEDNSIELNVATGVPIGGSGSYSTVPFTDDAGAIDGGIILKSSTVDSARGVRDKVFLYRTSSPASGWISNLRLGVSGNYGKDTLSLVDPSDTTNNRNIGLSISGANTTDAVNLYRASGNVLATDDVILSTISSGKQTLVLSSQNTTIGMTIGHDTNLFRSGVGVLQTDNLFSTTANSGKNTLHLNNTTANVGMTIGHDTNLFRSGVGVLQTDNLFSTTANSGKNTLHLNNTTANVGMTIGHDTVLYRSGANVLATDDRFGITLDDGKDTLHLSNDTVNVGLTIGNNTDRVELYRASGNVLATDDVILSTIASGKNTISLTDTSTNVGLTLGHDTTLYRSGANVLSADDRFGINFNGGKNTLHLIDTTVNVGMTIAHDTNLYRSGIDTLRTDDNLGVVLNFNVDGNTILGDATSDTVTFNARANSNLEPSANNARNLGSSALNWGTAFINTLEVAANSTLTGDLSVQGNTTLGNATSDTVTFTARAASELTPSTNNTRNLGSSALNWGTAFINTLQVAANSTLTGDLSVQGNVTLGDGATDTVTINAGPISLVNATAAGDALEFGAGANLANLYRSANDTLRTDDSLIVNTNLSVNGNATLGDAYADTVLITGKVLRGILTYSGAAVLVQAGSTSIVSDKVIITGAGAADGALSLPAAIVGMEIEVKNRAGQQIRVYANSTPGTDRIFDTSTLYANTSALQMPSNTNKNFVCAPSGGINVWFT